MGHSTLSRPCQTSGSTSAWYQVWQDASLLDVGTTGCRFEGFTTGQGRVFFNQRDADQDLARLNRTHLAA